VQIRCEELVHPERQAMNILRISSSPRGAESDSHRLSETIVRSLSEQGGTTIVTDRMIGVDPIPHIDHTYVAPAADRELHADASTLRSEALIRELDGADVLVLATPMHNYGLPSVLKAWIDHVVRAGHTFDVTPHGKIGRLRDRPVFVAVSSGGRISGDRARQPDFLTPHLKALLATIGLHDVSFFTIEGTVSGSQVLQDAWHDAERRVRAHFASASRHGLA
jgi:FMN-dependent NADH-azoreductase